MTTLQVGEISASPGTKATGFLQVPTTRARMPLTLINGVNDGPTLLITAGVHGGEYPPIEAAIRFAIELDPAQISGQIIVVSIVSLDSFHARQMFVVPDDGKNLNRQFPGKALGTVSERIAHTLMTEVVSHANAWVDLHCGDIHEGLIPFVGYFEAADPAVNAQTRGMMEVFGIEYVAKPGRLPGTTTQASAAIGIPCLLAEAGNLAVLDEENTQILLNGCRNVARYFKILPGEAQKQPLKEFTDWPWLRSAQTGCWYPAVKLGDTVDEGQMIGVVKDYFGNVMAEYRSPAHGIVILLFASMAVNEGDPLAGVAVV
jgi:predicted deacylase